MKTKILSFVFLLSGIFIHSSIQAQLNGNYTINADAATGGTNFNSFGDFSTALGSGVSGPVSVSVVSGSGPYDEYVVFTSVSGASPTNTITINGNGEKIRNTSNNVGTVIRLSGADHFTFNNLVVEAASSIKGTRCFWLLNGADHNRITNCELLISAYADSSFSAAYVIFSGSSTGFSAGSHGSDNTISNNLMWSGGDSLKGPDYGIGDYRTTDEDVNLVVTNNEIRDFRRTVLHINKISGVQFISNHVHKSRADASEIICFYLASLGTSGSSIPNQFDKNVIENLRARSTLQPFAIYGATGKNNKSISFNDNLLRNCYAGQFTYGFIVQFSRHIEFENNGIYNCGSGFYLNKMGFYVVACTNINILDNHMENNYGISGVDGAIQLYDSDTINIDGNTISNNSGDKFFQYLIDLQRCENFMVNANRLSGNTNTNIYPTLGEIRLNGCNHGMVTNNVMVENFGTQRAYGLYVNESDSLKIYHNTFHSPMVGSADIAWYLANTTAYTSVEMVNNILYCDWDGQGNILPIYCKTFADSVLWENNVIFDDSGTVNYHADGSSYSSFGAWASAVGDVTSVEADPEFTDVQNYNLKPTNSDIDNIGTPSLVQFDFDGVARSSTPDPGALEFSEECLLNSYLTSRPDSNGTVIGGYNTLAAENQMFISYGPQSMVIYCHTNSTEALTYSFSGLYLSQGTNDSNVIFSPENAGVYTIECIVSSENCSDTSDIEICVIDATGDNPNDKNYRVKVCHQPDDSSQSPVTISISINAVQTHLTGHDGCKLGGCSASCADNNGFTSETTDWEYDRHIDQTADLSQLIAEVYPNPGSTSFNVHLASESDELVNITVTDLTGRVLIDQQNVAPNGTVKIGESLTTGLYLLHVRQGNEVHTFKIIKE